MSASLAAAACDLLGPAKLAASAAGEASEQRKTGRQECRWQQTRLPPEIRELVLDDRKNRNEICWRVFQC